MMVLWECGAITEKELGERIHLDSGTLAPLLKRLDKQGLVKRERPNHNERLLQITLTDAGIALQEEALSVPETMKNCIGLSVEECSVLCVPFLRTVRRYYDLIRGGIRISLITAEPMIIIAPMIPLTLNGSRRNRAEKISAETGSI